MGDQRVVQGALCGAELQGEQGQVRDADLTVAGEVVGLVVGAHGQGEQGLVRDADDAVAVEVGGRPAVPEDRAAAVGGVLVSFDEPPGVALERVQDVWAGSLGVFVL